MGTCRDDSGLLHTHPPPPFHPWTHSRVWSSVWRGRVPPTERNSTCSCCSSHLWQRHSRLLCHWIPHPNCCLVSWRQASSRDDIQPWRPRRDLGSTSSGLPHRG